MHQVCWKTNHHHHFRNKKNNNPVISIVAFTIKVRVTLLVNDQLDALPLMYLFILIYFTSLHVSNSTVFIIRRSIVLIHHLVCIGLCRWLHGMPAYQAVTYIDQYIPDDVLIQSISWWWTLCCSKHVERWS